MSDVVQRADEAGKRIAALQKERAERLASALAHEDEARKDRLRATECKNEIAEWTAALNSANVQRSVETAQEAAQKAQASAEAHEKKLAASLAEVEKLKADLTAQVLKETKTKK